ncbi:hypothetical protein O5D80_001591 [Batrachochytrium dendrobatidis]|nr:hypothetical protein O5D80_000008 [Batrachochytrium dendrobatidis]KAJ8329938.1 hypothetical protein O5D80_002124 [Batrachochytrium dendrobatidis]KAJ8330013.1 hypothetical protein O5D80_001591 [Batrachochytrium dendrobatidis]
MADIVVPLPSSSNNVGSTPESISSGKPVTIRYKSRKYRGISSTAVVTIPGTRIAGINLPVLSVERQSAGLVGIGGNPDQGVFGFAYSSLSDHHPPATAMDVLYTSDVIPNNEVGIQLCPYDMLQESSINIGNTDITAKCGTDGRSVAWVQSPTNNQFSVNIKNILINDEQANLPAEFQKKTRKEWTYFVFILQTCFMCIHFPKTVVAALVDAILDSGAIRVKSILFRNKLGKIAVKNRLQGNHPMSKFDFKIKWEKLPSLSITMFAQTPVTDDNRNSVVAIRLGPKDYIQIIDSKHVEFIVAAGPNDNVILGIPFMTRLRLTFDRTHKRIGLGPGCGCEVSTDGYPTISNADQVLWSPSQLPEQPSTSSSGDTSTLRRSFSRLGSTLRGSRRSKPNYKKFDGYWPLN